MVAYSLKGTASEISPLYQAASSLREVCENFQKYLGRGAHPHSIPKAIIHR